MAESDCSLSSFDGANMFQIEPHEKHELRRNGGKIKIKIFINPLVWLWITNKNNKIYLKIETNVNCRYYGHFHLELSKDRENFIKYDTSDKLFAPHKPCLFTVNDFNIVELNRIHLEFVQVRRKKRRKY